MQQKTAQKIVLGTVVGTMIGSALVLLAPHRQTILKQVRDQSRRWREKTKNTAKEITGLESQGDSITKFFTGAVIGLLLGGGVIGLTTPKTGKQVRKELLQKYRSWSKKTNEIAHLYQNNFHPLKKAVKSVVRKAKSSV